MSEEQLSRRFLLFCFWSGSQLGEGDAVNAPNPTRQVTLVSEACPGRDYGEVASPFPDKLNRALQSEVHDVTVRRHADGSGKYAREMERAARCKARQRRNLDRLLYVGNDVISEASEHFLAEHTSWLLCDLRRMARDQPANKRIGELVPKERPVRIAPCALVDQVHRKVEKRLIVAGQALHQLRCKRRPLRDSKGESARINRYQNSIDASLGVSSAVDTNWTYSEGTCLRHM
jgi:hypothetical protein